MHHRIDLRSVPSDPVPLPGPAAAPAHEQAAERITEEVLQLLFVAQHEIADLAEAHDPHADLARLRIRDAISSLRDVVVLLHPERTGLAVRPLPDLVDGIVPPLGRVGTAGRPALDAA